MVYGKYAPRARSLSTKITGVLVLVKRRGDGFDPRHQKGEESWVGPPGRAVAPADSKRMRNMWATRLCLNTAPGSVLPYSARTFAKAEVPLIEKATILVGDAKLEVPVVVGSENESAIDVAQLRAKTGYVTLDPAFMNTASTTSAITFIDGDKGILR